MNTVQSSRLQAASAHLPITFTQRLSQEWLPQSRTPSICHPHSAAKETTYTAQTSIQQTSAKSSSTCSSPTTSPPLSAPATNASRTQTGISGTAAVVKGNVKGSQTGGAEITVPTRRCRTTSKSFTRTGVWTSSRLRTGFWSRWLCGQHGRVVL
jgi:hypothetical protein